jgi:hypothetical protein
MYRRVPLRQSVQSSSTVHVLANLKRLPDDFPSNKSFQAVVFDFPCVLEEIGGSTFQACLCLQSICIPATVTRLRDRCFSGCSSLETFGFEPFSRLEDFGERVFLCCFRLQSISIPRGVTAIGRCCFAHCHSLSQVHFESPSRLWALADSTFHDCPSLQSISLPSSVWIVGPYCFRDCTSLSNVAVQRGSQVQKLCECAFFNCPALRSFVVPSSVKDLVPRCFFRCSNLSELLFETPSHVKQVILGIPSEFSGGELQIPSSVTALRLTAESAVNSPVVVRFERDSSLTELTIAPDRRLSLCRGFFLRLSERTLKSFRFRDDQSISVEIGQVLQFSRECESAMVS